jgi:hypothetical protein
VQLRRWLRPTAVAVGLCAACPPAGWAAGAVDQQTADYLLQFFTDSDHVAVRSSIGQYEVALKREATLSLHWNNERVVIPAVKASAGTQEAIDAITTASRPIAGNAFQDFIKVRNEFQGEVKQGHASARYYVSSESDYLGQQIAANVDRDLEDQLLNLSVGTSYGWDAIKPVADDDSQTGDATKTNLHVNTVATRVLTPTTLVRCGVELNLVHGLQHNPYRHVYAGGTNVAERHPDHRQRRDAFVKLNQYLSNRSSMKLSYRFYNDDWGINSHEIGTILSQYITRGIFARYHYRYYTQTSADFYSDNYTSTSGIDGFLTGDYRMGPLSSHLFGAGLNFGLEDISEDSPLLQRMGVWLNYERYFNSNNYSSNTLATGLSYRF